MPAAAAAAAATGGLGLTGSTFLTRLLGGGVGVGTAASAAGGGGGSGGAAQAHTQQSQLVAVAADATTANDAAARQPHHPLQGHSAGVSGALGSGGSRPSGPFLVAAAAVVAPGAPIVAAAAILNLIFLPDSLQWKRAVERALVYCNQVHNGAIAALNGWHACSHRL